jgi:hypothetical protein
MGRRFRNVKMTRFPNPEILTDNERFLDKKKVLLKRKYKTSRTSI